MGPKKEDRKAIKLNSPCGADPAILKWPLVSTEVRDGGNEIIEIMKHVCEDYPELALPVNNYIIKDFDSSSYETVKKSCDKFNRAIAQINLLFSGTSRPGKQRTNPSRKLLKHILQLSYNTAVTDAEKLNEYQPFSPQVYGETSFDLICKMLDDVPMRESDTFIDLGSGVGQVVLQVAALTNCKMCYGIELSDTCVEYANKMESEFRFWMNWYGKVYSDFELVKGDFLDENYASIISSSSFIFVNNFAFGPTVDHQLKLRFQNLKDGTRIVASKAFAPIKFRTSGRNLSDIATIMKVSELARLKGSVSWTENPVSYYLHVIDTTLLETYFEKQKAGRHGGGSVKSDESSEKDENVDSPQNSGAIEPAAEIKVKAEPKGRNSRRSSRRVSSSAALLQSSDSSTPSPQAFAADGAAGTSSNRKQSSASASDPHHDSQLSPPPSKAAKKDSGLDLLHSQAVSSLSSSCVSPGGAYKELTVRVEDLEGKSGGSGSSSFVKPTTYIHGLDEFMQNMRNQFVDFIELMSTPEYAAQLTAKIEEEKERGRGLRSKIAHVQGEIHELEKQFIKTFNLRLTELGIQANSPAEFVDKAKSIISVHQWLREKMREEHLLYNQECEQLAANLEARRLEYEEMAALVLEREGRQLPPFDMSTVLALNMKPLDEMPAHPHSAHDFFKSPRSAAGGGGGGREEALHVLQELGKGEMVFSKEPMEQQGVLSSMCGMCGARKNVMSTGMCLDCESSNNLHRSMMEAAAAAAGRNPGHHPLDLMGAAASGCGGRTPSSFSIDSLVSPRMHQSDSLLNTPSNQGGSGGQSGGGGGGFCLPLSAMSSPILRAGLTNPHKLQSLSGSAAAAHHDDDKDDRSSHEGYSSKYRHSNAAAAAAPQTPTRSHHQMGGQKGPLMFARFEEHNRKRGTLDLSPVNPKLTPYTDSDRIVELVDKVATCTCNKSAEEQEELCYQCVLVGHLPAELRPEWEDPKSHLSFSDYNPTTRPSHFVSHASGGSGCVTSPAAAAAHHSPSSSHGSHSAAAAATASSDRIAAESQDRINSVISQVLRSSAHSDHKGSAYVPSDAGHFVPYESKLTPPAAVEKVRSHGSSVLAQSAPPPTEMSQSVEERPFSIVMTSREAAEDSRDSPANPQSHFDFSKVNFEDSANVLDDNSSDAKK